MATLRGLVAAAPRPCVATAAAVCVLAPCGGGEQPGDAQGPRTVTQAIGGGSAQVSIQRCETGEGCVEAPPECEEILSCIEEFCAAESGGCEPAFVVFGDPEGLRACFDLRVVDVTRAVEDPRETPPSDTGQSETVGTPSTAVLDRTVECVGPSLRLDGLDLSDVPVRLETSTDGSVMWSEEEIRVAGEVVDGVFQVTAQP